MPIIKTVGDWPHRAAELPSVALPSNVLMADPAEFRIEEVHNSFMSGDDGQPLAVDRELAQRQWRDLVAAFQQHAGLHCTALAPSSGQVDLCFTANPSMALPLPDGSTEIWLGRMTHGSRRSETSAHEDHFQKFGFAIKSMPDHVTNFEGHGDGILHPGRFLLHVGVGPRSCAAAWDALACAHPQLDLLLYELQDPRFYHLDTALAALDETTALYVPGAFSDQGLELVLAAFPNAIPLSDDEALNFAGNAFCPDKKHVFLQAGNPELENKLRKGGFEPVSVDTSEFMKSGGSVFCLKMAY